MSVGPVDERSLDWNDARERFRRHFRSSFPRWGADEHEELASKAVVRLLRALRSRPALHLHGLISKIAGDEESDAIRGWRRRTARNVALDDRVEPPTPEPAIECEAEDPLTRQRWLLLTYFERRDARCLDVARRLLAGETLRAIAECEGRSHDALRQQWHRCVVALRGAIAPGDPLWDWIHERE